MSDLYPTGFAEEDDSWAEGSVEVDTDLAAEMQAKEQQEFMDSLPKAAQERRAKEAEEEQATAEKEASLKARTGELVEEKGAPLTGLAKWAEENVFIPLVDQFDGSRDADQVAKDRASLRQGQVQTESEVIADQEASSNVFSEVNRAVVGGSLDFFNESAETADLAGDTVKTWLGIADEEDRVWNEDGSNNPDYERAEFNLTLSENKTFIGKLARGFFRIRRGMKLIPGGNAIKGRTATARAQRVAVETARAAVVDMLSTDVDDGTLTQQVGEFFGVEADTPMVGWFVNAMSIDRDDNNPWEAKIKGSVEGGILGSTFDSISEFLGVARVARRASIVDGKRVASLAERKRLINESLDRQAQEVVQEMADMKARIKAEADAELSSDLDKAWKTKQEVDAEFESLKNKVEVEKDEALRADLDAAWNRKQQIDTELDKLRSDVEAGRDYSGTQRNLPIDLDEAGPLGLRETFDTVQQRPSYGRQLTLEDAGLDTTPDLARQIRRNQDVVYGGSPTRESLYEIDEKAARISTNNVNDVIKSQAKVDNLYGDLGGRSAKPLLNDGAIKQIIDGSNIPGATRNLIANTDIPKAQVGTQAFTEAATNQLRAVAGSAEEADGLVEVIKRVESGIDFKKLSSDVSQTTSQYKATVYNTLARFLGGQELSAEEALKAFDGVTNTDVVTGAKTFSDEGITASKVIIADLSLQLNDLAGNALDLLGSGRDFPIQQSDMILDRLSALVKTYKRTTLQWGRRGGVLKRGPLKGLSEAEMSKAMDEIDTFFKDFKDKLAKGDEKSIQELKDMASGLSLADGDPLKILTWAQTAKKLGWQAAIKVFYNSLLSGPVTHARNAIGNASVMVLRPTTMALGQALSGDVNAAKASLASMSAIIESFPEAVAAAGRAWNMGSTAGGGGKFAVKGQADVAEGLALLKNNAKTDSEKNAAAFLDMLHNNAVLNAPTNALGAGDDFFKTINARMELKRQVMMESMDSAGNIKFDPKRYEDLVNEKIVNGEITDEGLLKLTKEQTFQQELEGTAKKIQDLFESVPAGKFLVPFIRTPHNLMVYSGTYLPGLNRFLKEANDIRNGSDEAAKAMLRGREAMGVSVIASGFAFAAQGLLTGNGPADPEMNRIWRESNEPQSIKIGDKWISYAAIEPLNVMFAASADLQQIGPYLKGADYNRLAAQLQWTFAKAFFERSYYKGIQTAIAYLNPGSAGNVDPGREVAGFVNNMVPFAGLRRQMTKTLTPDMMEFNAEYQRVIQYSFPGVGGMAAKMLGAESKISPFSGRPVIEDKKGNIGMQVMNAFLPFNISDAKDDFVLKSLQDYMIDTKTGFGESYKGMEITPADQGEINKLVYRSGMKDRLQAIFESDEFLDSYAEWEALVKTGKPYPRKEQGWYGLITTELSQSRERAANAYAKLNEDFGYRVRQHQTSTYLQKKGRYEALQQFATP